MTSAFQQIFNTFFYQKYMTCDFQHILLSCNINYINHWNRPMGQRCSGKSFPNVTLLWQKKISICALVPFSHFLFYHYLVLTVSLVVYYLLFLSTTTTFLSLPCASSICTLRRVHARICRTLSLCALRTRSRTLHTSIVLAISKVWFWAQKPRATIIATNLRPFPNNFPDAAASPLKLFSDT